MGTSASFALARKTFACFIAALLSLALMPASALAEDEHPGAEGSEGAFGSEVPTSPQPPSDPSTEASGSSVILSEGSEAAEVEGSNSKPLTLASGLFGAPSNFINSEVALDSEPIIGSFTVDGLTYAVIDEFHIELVGVSPDWQQVMSSQEGEGASVAPMLASGSDGDEPDAAALVLPETVTYEGATYTLASIAPYAFYLSGVTDVMLPASVSDVDDRAFRSSDVANVSVAEGNPTYTSFDGALYSADKTRLLLIPEGRVGAVLLPREAEVAEASKFSHCSLVDAISVEDGAAFASENGLLYTSDLTTLLRVPAGATDITIREGCTSIAAGALEACAKLTTINAPSTVTSISPDVFHAIPTVSLPAASLTESSPQLTAMVALSTSDDDLPKVNPSAITVNSLDEALAMLWRTNGFSVAEGDRAESPIRTTGGPSVPYDTQVFGGRPNVTAHLGKTLGVGSSSFTLPESGDSALRGFNGYTLEYDEQYGYFFLSSKSDHYWFEDKTALTYAHAIRIGSPDGPMYSHGQMPSVIDQRNIFVYPDPKDYDLGFDVNSELGDEDYPGTDKPDQTIAGEQIEAGDEIEIEDPKRPGYVFQGWTIPNAEGTEAIDQDLVYKGEDGKWYVDASKLPDYAGDDGRVELTARWTSVISVDVPSSVTFYADVVTQGSESREGLASSAFGQNKVQSQSEVDLRIVGLESKQVKGNGSTSLGAADILKKEDGSAVSGTDDKLFSLYPATGDLKEDDLKDPDATSASKPEGAVDFSLDDILLEKSFAADDFTIPAGDTLSLGYRLNLQETSTELDYDKLSTLSEGTSASIANISYCFATDAHFPTATGSKDDPLWIEYGGRIYGLQDIKDSAECIAELGSASPCYEFYKGLLDGQVMTNGNPGSGPYFQLKVDGAYLPLQLIGIAQDVKSDGTGKAGLTFQMRDVYANSSIRSTAAGGGTFDTRMNPSNVNSGGWSSSLLRSTLRSAFWDKLPSEIQAAIVLVDKFQQLRSSETDPATSTSLQKTIGETIWLPSDYEMFGTVFSRFNDSEGLTTVAGYVPFQYMAYQPGGTSTMNTHVIKTYNGSAVWWWTRSTIFINDSFFCGVNADGGFDSNYASGSIAASGAGIATGVTPCFCL